MCVFSSIRGSRTGAPEAFGASFATIFVFSCRQGRGRAVLLCHEFVRVPAFLPTYCSSVWSILKGSAALSTEAPRGLTALTLQGFGPEFLSCPPQVGLGRLEPGNPVTNMSREAGRPSTGTRNTGECRLKENSFLLTATSRNQSQRVRARLPARTATPTLRQAPPGPRALGVQDPQLSLLRRCLQALYRRSNITVTETSAELF